MKMFIWTVTGFLALLWTGVIAMLTAAVTWFAGASADQASRGVQAMAQWPVPDWVGLWIPAAAVESLKASVTGLLESGVTAFNWIGPMLGWLSPLIWAVWGLVLLLMLALAGGVHFLMARTTRPA